MKLTALQFNSLMNYVKEFGYDPKNSVESAENLSRILTSEQAPCVTSIQMCGSCWQEYDTNAEHNCPKFYGK